MSNYYKYLPLSQQDEDWGLHVLNTGHNRVVSRQEYPSPAHPGHHYFTWNKGRILQEFQVVYITNGNGYFESAHCALKKIQAGTVFILFPGEWHRFKPDSSTGWDEYWVGFEGSILKKLFAKKFFELSTPIFHIGLHENILAIFNDIIKAAETEKAGYQPYISGAVLHLLGQIYMLMKQQSIPLDDQTEALITKAKILLRKGIDCKLSIGKVADELQVSYSWFRKTFKTYTGIAPGQYLQQLRIEQAKFFLLDRSRTVKSIAYDLNFTSAFHFSALFKAKTSLSPAQYQKKFAGRK
jgi:AraC-like DNA-binding protein